MTHHNRDTWNKHKWRKETSWWDNLTVDGELIKERYADVFEWLEEVAPDPYEHDCVLYTDGSGCTEGWGGYAAVWERIDLIGEVRAPVSRGCYVAGTYGSTVSRSEFSALLDGVHSILTERGRELQEQTTDSAELYKIGTEGILNQFTGPDRVSILWAHRSQQSRPRVPLQRGWRPADVPDEGARSVDALVVHGQARLHHAHVPPAQCCGRAGDL